MSPSCESTAPPAIAPSRLRPPRLATRPPPHPSPPRRRCIDNFFSATAATLEFAAAVQLRRRRPAMSRPFRIPCGTAGVAALVALPIVIALFVCVSTAMETRATLTIIVVGLAFGLLLYLPLWLRSGAAEAEGAEPAAPSEEGGEQGAAGDSCAPRVNSPPRAIS